MQLALTHPKLGPVARSWGVLAAAIAVSVSSSGSAHAAERPNIVVVMSDDMGFSDIGCYGGEIETPVLDRLAEGGVRFSQFYNTARCCPTRASLLTGLYPHQAGIGHMTGDYGLPSYRGTLSQETATIAEALRPAGYRTYMSGKWHVTGSTEPDGDRETWPLRRGFDKFYGTIIGAGSFFDPTTLCRGETYITPENDPHYQPEVYYYTDAISDNAVAFLEQHAGESSGSPFFLYVSYTAAHWPMHALPEDIERYDGKYDGGYEEAYAARLGRLRELGIADPRWKVPPPVGDWDSVTNKEWESACMEVYAAMVDRMDQGIAKIVAELKRQKVFENTLVLYLQDNGGCAEGLGRRSNAAAIEGKSFEPLGRDGLQPKIWPEMQTRDGRPVRTGPDVMPGPEDTYIAYGRAWANVSNTPFREYKHWVHEGGISTPLIAHWPAGSVQTNAWVEEPAHLIDIMATCLDLAGAGSPDGSPAPEGTSLVPALRGEGLGRTSPIFWEHEGNRAVREGRWKLVAKGVDGPWELYDIDADRTEMQDLAAAEPDRVKAMIADYDAWAARCGVVPFNSWKKKGKSPAR